jgi:hypothetical protein
MIVTQDRGESNVQTAHPPCLRPTCHVANMCLHLGRRNRRNPVVETCVGDAEADRLLARATRNPWRV